MTSLHHSLTETQKELREAGRKEKDEFAVSATQAEVNSLQVNVLLECLCVVCMYAYVVNLSPGPWHADKGIIF